MTHDLRLNCTKCNDFTEYETGKNAVVRCSECGKKHSDDSVWMVKLGKDYERAADGTLLEDPI